MLPWPCIKVENFNETDMQKLQEDARAIIRERYTWEKIVDQYKALILEEVRSRGMRRF